MDLFEHHFQQREAREAPLADRMRPLNLDEFVGQGHILAPGRLLRRAIEADQLSSLIFFGPPGTGKTTLARIIANTTRAYFITLNAVLAGVKDIRESIATAQEKRRLYGQRTILFIDEVHRFNKSQQDALLPWVERGTVILIGATTENPYFEVNKALVSRSRLFQLRSLESKDLEQILQHTLSDRKRGYGELSIEIAPQANQHLIDVANGDARALLNALELAVETTPPDEESLIHITLSVAEDSIQQRAVLYDKEGDAHFDTISAFIKSVRGSDPDAALYWLAKMVYAGENPRFIFRRLLILASEDVGLADPQAIVVVQSCASAFEQVGMPEGRYHLAQATLYLANTKKSNSIMGFFDALDAVERELEPDVPNHLKDANRDKKGLGHGAGYLYPHAYQDHWVAQQYLPSSFQGRVFYQPSRQGFEAAIQTQLARQHEAQLAAFSEGFEGRESFTYGEVDKTSERWLQRTFGQVEKQLAQIRERIFSMASLERQHVVLDLKAGTGLLTWEAIRQVTEGGVYARTETNQEAEDIEKLAKNIINLRRPKVIISTLRALPEELSTQAATVKFDRILGRNVLWNEKDKANLFEFLPNWLFETGVLVLMETIPRLSQRIYSLISPDDVGHSLYSKWEEAEEQIYQSTDDPMFNWDVKDLELYLKDSGLLVDIELETSSNQLYISPGLLERWFASTTNNEQITYATRLGQTLSKKEIQTIQECLNRKLLRQTVSWSNVIACCLARKKNTKE
ncbi:MAG: AAA family ATPase [Cyanobacteria bacterium P01_H01_bin.15]